MKVRVTQEIDSTTPGKPLAVGTILSDPNCWRLCTIFRDGEPVAEPDDDEAKERAQPDLDRLEELRRKLISQAENFQRLQAD